MFSDKKEKQIKGFPSVKEAVGSPAKKVKGRTRIVKADSEDFLKQTAETKEKQQKESKKPKKNREKLKKRLTSLLGGAFIFFAIVGIISTASGVVKLTKNIINENSRKTKYAQFLSPIIMLDPVYFDSSAKASQSFLIQSSLWYLIYNNGSDYYPIDDIGNVTIPASDVEVAAATIFGKSAELVHQSVGDITNITTYLEETATYHLPLSSGYNIYTPLIHDISKSGETVTLTVGYLPPSPNWGDDRVVSSIPDKFASYVIKENSSGMTLVAIKEMSSEQQEALIAKYSAKD